MPGAAPAAPPPTQLGGGMLVLSAERLFGFSSWSGTVTRPGIDPNTLAETEVDLDSSGTSVNLLWASSNTGADEFSTNPYAVPRLGIDFIVGPGVSIGGSIGYIASSGEADESTTVTEDLAEITALAVAPRVGFAIMFNPIVGIWPRAGFTYISVSVTNTDPTTNTSYDDTYTFQNLTLEGLLVISPAPHFGITVGPVIDLGVGGSWEVERPDGTGGVATSDGDLNFGAFGLVGGLLGYF